MPTANFATSPCSNAEKVSAIASSWIDDVIEF